MIRSSDTPPCNVRVLLAVGVVASMLTACSNAMPVESESPDLNDWEVLRAGQQSFDLSVEHVSTALGPPSSFTEWEVWGGLCNFWVQATEPIRYQGHGEASWDDVPSTVQQQLRRELADRWEAEGLQTSILSDDSGTSLVAEIRVSGASFQVHARALEAPSPGNFSVSGNSGCYSKAGLADTTGDDEARSP